MKQLLLKSITSFALSTFVLACFAQTPQFPPAYPQPQVYAYPNANYGQAPVYPQNPQMMPTMPNQAMVKPLSKPRREFSGYLGIATDILPSSVAAQLPDGVTQGILIKEFAPDSPAHNSELKPYDVLVAYGNTKINHPAQFVKLVRNDTPGNKVIFKVVRKGKLLDIPVTIGSQKTPDPKEFNGLAIVQTGKNTYRATIRYIGPSGNKQIRVFKGTREELFDQAQQAFDLPPAERQQLLFATRPRNNSNSGFGSFFPFGKNESGKDWMNPRRFFKW